MYALYAFTVFAGAVKLVPGELASVFVLVVATVDTVATGVTNDTFVAKYHFRYVETDAWSVGSVPNHTPKAESELLATVVTFIRRYFSYELFAAVIGLLIDRFETFEF